MLRSLKETYKFTIQKITKNSKYLLSKVWYGCYDFLNRVHSMKSFLSKTRYSVNQDSFEAENVAYKLILKDTRLYIPSYIVYVYKQ